MMIKAGSWPGAAARCVTPRSARRTAAGGLVEIKRHDELTAAQRLAELRWPGGFMCACGSRGGWQLKARPRVYECATCHRQYSVTAGTALHRMRGDLTKLFLAARLMNEHKRNGSERFLQRKLNLTYQRARTMAYKLERSNVVDDLARLARQADAAPHQANRPVAGRSRSRNSRVGRHSRGSRSDSIRSKIITADAAAITENKPEWRASRLARDLKCSRQYIGKIRKSAGYAADISAAISKELEIRLATHDQADRPGRLEPVMSNAERRRRIAELHPPIRRFIESAAKKLDVHNETVTIPSPADGQYYCADDYGQYLVDNDLAYVPGFEANEPPSTPGAGVTINVENVDDQVRQRWREAYAAWKAGQAALVAGLLAEEWPVIVERIRAKNAAIVIVIDGLGRINGDDPMSVLLRNALGVTAPLDVPVARRAAVERRNRALAECILEVERLAWRGAPRTDDLAERDPYQGGTNGPPIRQNIVSALDSFGERPVRPSRHARDWSKAGAGL